VAAREWRDFALLFSHYTGVAVYGMDPDLGLEGLGKDSRMPALIALLYLAERSGQPDQQDRARAWSALHAEAASLKKQRRGVQVAREYSQLIGPGDDGVEAYCKACADAIHRERELDDKACALHAQMQRLLQEILDNLLRRDRPLLRRLRAAQRRQFVKAMELEAQR
jgi:hypothetical protein